MAALVQSLAAPTDERNTEHLVRAFKTFDMDKDGHISPTYTLSARLECSPSPDALGGLNGGDATLPSPLPVAAAAERCRRGCLCECDASLLLLRLRP